MPVEFCFCGAVGSTWEHENPFRRQGVSHSPDACQRGVYAAENPVQLEPAAPPADAQLTLEDDPELRDMLS